MKVKLLCYKCHKPGIGGYGWAESSAHPRYDRNKVIYGQYFTRYVRHYSAEKYRKMMERYRSGHIKSRPNGQKRCYSAANVFWDTSKSPYIAYCENEPLDPQKPFYLGGQVLCNIKKKPDSRDRKYDYKYFDKPVDQRLEKIKVDRY